jgi:hypothetical protein
MATASEQARTLISRAVIWTGIVLGTALTVLAMWNGVRLRIPNIPSIVGAVLGAVITWVLFMAVAALLSELTVRHHRAALRHGWRYGQEGARAATRFAGTAARGAATRSRPWRTRLLGAIQARWAARRPEPLVFRRTPRDPATGDPEPVSTEPDPTPDIDAHPDPTGGTDMTETTDDPNTRPRGRRPNGRGGGGYSAAWKTLTAETGDFEPEDDGHLMAWMAGEVNGMSSYAEAITDVYETAVSGVGLDPVSMAALHDYADAAAEAAQAMAAARQKFASHYQEVREFAAAGGLLPHDGRWITGEGE